MKIKELREQQHLTQTKVAQDLNLPKMTYHNYEAERNQPNIETLIKLADYYDVSLDYLVGRNFNNEVGYLTKEESEFVKLFLQLNEQNKYKLIGFATGLYAQQEEE